ncbi:MAG: hypothetical protein IPP71_06600 [Bacteroidetes bacterium]|nr:hypothetical protein [Bacteroidota bacterium]
MVTGLQLFCGSSIFIGGVAATREMADGVYFYKIMSSGNNFKTDKFVVNK